MTNEEKLRETFPKTIFIFQKNGKDETTAIMCSDEWLQRDYDQMYKDSEPCEDCVSRADTLQSFESYCEKNCQYSKKQRDVMCGACMMGDAIEIVENLPPVTPKPKPGHWMITSDYLTTAYGTIDYVKCSCCHEDSLEEGNYCPNCGAKMIEPQESEDRE